MLPEPWKGEGATPGQGRQTRRGGRRTSKAPRRRPVGPVFLNGSKISNRIKTWPLSRIARPFRLVWWHDCVGWWSGERLRAKRNCRSSARLLRSCKRSRALRKPRLAILTIGQYLGSAPIDSVWTLWGAAWNLAKPLLVFRFWMQHSTHHHLSIICKGNNTWNQKNTWIAFMSLLSSLERVQFVRPGETSNTWVSGKCFHSGGGRGQITPASQSSRGGGAEAAVGLHWRRSPKGWNAFWLMSAGRQWVKLCYFGIIFIYTNRFWTVSVRP